MNMDTAQQNHFQRLLELAEDSSARTEIGERLRAEGFPAVRRFLDDFRDYLRRYDEEEDTRAAGLLARAIALLPEPGRVSPSWTDIWKEFDTIIRTKRYLFHSIGRPLRSGEWQVLLDNPYSNQEIAVYPDLSFLEAVYMFAYFRADMVPNEFIRLQKVETVVTLTGADRTGLE